MLFDASSDKMEERKQALSVTLSGTGFSRTTAYKLVMLDTENNMKYNSFTVTIDLAFEDDFFWPLYWLNSGQSRRRNLLTAKR